jgi:hypothetical protein
MYKFIFVLTISFPLLAQEANLENNAINDSSDSATVTYSENRILKRKANYWTIAGSFALVYYYGAEAWTGEREDLDGVMKGGLVQTLHLEVRISWSYVGTLCSNEGF